MYYFVTKRALLTQIRNLLDRSQCGLVFTVNVPDVLFYTARPLNCAETMMFMKIDSNFTLLFSYKFDVKY